MLQSWKMKHRVRHSPIAGQSSTGSGQHQNCHKSIAINNDDSFGNNKLHRRRRNLKGFGPAHKLLVLSAAAVVVIPIIVYYVSTPPFRGDVVSERILFNAPSSLIHLRLSTSYLPRNALYLSWHLDQEEATAAHQPRATAMRRTELVNSESILMSEKYARKLEDSHDWNKRARDPLYEGDCIPMRPWQEMLFPACSKFHEMDMSNVHSSYLVDKKRRVDRRFRKINNGGYNDVFNFHMDPPNEEDIVYKVLTYGTEYTDRNYDRVRRDALIMERGTKSNYLVDVYGHCGLSLLTPLGTEGTIWDVLDTDIDKSDKLELASQAASGLAAAHDLDGDGISAITQGDLKADQYLLIDGYFKLNDFNRGRFLRKNKKTGEACTYTIGNNDAKYRSPEEYRYDGETAKIDVWALGSIIYTILTQEGVWRGFSERRAQQRIAANEAPPIDRRWRESTDPIEALLYKVMYEMCFVPDVEKRSSAPEVARYIEIEGGRIMKSMKAQGDHQ